MRAAHTISAVDLFNNYKVEKLKGIGNIKRTYKSGCKKFLATKVFMYFLRLVLDDYVEGNMFHLPTKNIAYFGFKKINGPKFKSAYVSGKFPDLDYLMSDFSLYLPIFNYFYKGKNRLKNIVICDKHKKRMIEKTNEGFKYV
jgi:hypothetical protein